MSWTKLEPIQPQIIGCLNCGTLICQLPMDMLIEVGIGDASVTKDGKEVYSERGCKTNEDIWTVQDAENEALKDPEHDWRIVLFSAFRGRTFQRQGDKLWVLVEENEGFA